MPLLFSWTPHNSVFVFPTPKWNGHHFHQPIGTRQDTTPVHPWFQSIVMICNTVQNERNPAAAAEFVVASATAATQSSKNDDQVGKLDVNKNDLRPTKSKSKRSKRRKTKRSTPRKHQTHSSKPTKKDRIDSCDSKKKQPPEQRDEAEARVGSYSSVDDERLASDGGDHVDSARTLSKKDHKLALSLQNEEHQKSKQQRKREEKDRKLAQKLCEKEERASQKRMLHRERTAYTAMVATNVGKAVLAVERINELVDSLKVENNRFQFGLRSVGKETMVFFAEQLLAKQQKFKAQGIPFEVDVGYHYTDESSMNNIQANGLMTREDRLKKDIQARHRGAIFGDGIYTANNPISFQKYGKVGLIVARLQGKTVRVARSLRKEKYRSQGNTIVGDKTAVARWWWPGSDALHEIVLQTSCQCVPLVRYDRKSLRGSPFREWNPGDYLVYIADSLKAILDEIFNSHREAASKNPPKLVQELRCFYAQADLSAPPERFRYVDL